MHHVRVFCEGPGCDSLFVGRVCRSIGYSVCSIPCIRGFIFTRWVVWDFISSKEHSFDVVVVQARNEDISRTAPHPPQKRKLARTDQWSV